MNTQTNVELTQKEIQEKFDNSVKIEGGKIVIDDADLVKFVQEDMMQAKKANICGLNICKSGQVPLK